MRAKGIISITNVAIMHLKRGKLRARSVFSRNTGRFIHETHNSRLNNSVLVQGPLFYENKCTAWKRLDSCRLNLNSARSCTEQNFIQTNNKSTIVQNCFNCDKRLWCRDNFRAVFNLISTK